MLSPDCVDKELLIGSPCSAFCIWSSSMLMSLGTQWTTMWILGLLTSCGRPGWSSWLQPDQGTAVRTIRGVKQRMENLWHYFKSINKSLKKKNQEEHAHLIFVYFFIYIFLKSENACSLSCSVLYAGHCKPPSAFPETPNQAPASALPSPIVHTTTRQTLEMKTLNQQPETFAFHIQDWSPGSIADSFSYQCASWEAADIVPQVLASFWLRPGLWRHLQSELVK